MSSSEPYRWQQPHNKITGAMKCLLPICQGEIVDGDLFVELQQYNAVDTNTRLAVHARCFAAFVRRYGGDPSSHEITARDKIWSCSCGNEYSDELLARLHVRLCSS